MFNSNNNLNLKIYDIIFKKLLKFSICNQINALIFKALKNYRGKRHKNSLEANEIYDAFYKGYKIFKSIHSFLSQQIIQIKWQEMLQKIELAEDIFQVIKTHNSTLKLLYKFLCDNKLIKLFEKLALDLSQLYLQITIQNYYDDNKDKYAYLQEILSDLKRDCERIVEFVKDLSVMHPFVGLKNYL